MMSVTQAWPKLSQASTSTPRGPAATTGPSPRRRCRRRGRCRCGSRRGRPAEPRAVEDLLDAGLALLGPVRPPDERTLQRGRAPTRAAWRTGRRRNKGCCGRTVGFMERCSFRQILEPGRGTGVASKSVNASAGVPPATAAVDAERELDRADAVDAGYVAHLVSTSAAAGRPGRGPSRLCLPPSSGRRS